MHGEQWNDEHKMKEAFLPLEEDLSKSEDSGPITTYNYSLENKRENVPDKFQGALIDISHLFSK